MFAPHLSLKGAIVSISSMEIKAMDLFVNDGIAKRKFNPRMSMKNSTNFAFSKCIKINEMQFARYVLVLQISFKLFDAKKYHKGKFAIVKKAYI